MLIHILVIAAASGTGFVASAGTVLCLAGRIAPTQVLAATACGVGLILHAIRLAGGPAPHRLIFTIGLFSCVCATLAAGFDEPARALTWAPVNAVALVVAALEYSYWSSREPPRL